MKTEKVFAGLSLLGFILFKFNVPGGNFIFVISLLILALLYFPFGFYFISEKSIKLNTLTSVVFGWLLNMTIIGILFKLMHWPGAAIMLLVGIITALPLSAYSYTKFKSSEKENQLYYKNLLIRSITLLIFSIFVFII